MNLGTSGGGCGSQARQTSGTGSPHLLGVESEDPAYQLDGAAQRGAGKGDAALPQRCLRWHCILWHCHYEGGGAVCLLRCDVDIRAHAMNKLDVLQQERRQRLSLRISRHRMPKDITCTATVASYHASKLERARFHLCTTT